jgi:hypothetical protein
LARSKNASLSSACSADRWLLGGSPFLEMNPNFVSFFPWCLAGDNTHNSGFVLFSVPVSYMVMDRRNRTSPDVGSRARFKVSLGINQTVNQLPSLKTQTTRPRSEAMQPPTLLPCVAGEKVPLLEKHPATIVLVCGK